MWFMKYVVLTVLVWGFMAWGQDRGLLADAEQAIAQGRDEEGMALLSKYLEKSPGEGRALLLRAVVYSRQKQWEKAVKDCDGAIAADAKLVAAWHYRGVARFMLAEVKGAVADFDRELELAPDRAAGHWQRGIALYYSGRFEDGAKQFELHKTVNPQDVENAAWHFLCVAKWKGVEAARAGLIVVSEDPRVPMKQVQALFAGTAKLEEVIKAAQEGNAALRERQVFYANLYVGLYLEAVGNSDEAAAYLKKAAQAKEVGDYMHGVAVVDDGLREKARMTKPEFRIKSK